MATQNCPGVLQVEMQYIADGQTIENVFHVLKTTGAAWSREEITTALGEFQEVYWTGHQKALLPAQISLFNIVGTDLTSLEALKVDLPISPSEHGADASASLPANVTLAVKLAIANRGRGRSGRIFWPAIPETYVTENEVDPAYAANIIAAVQALVTAIDGIGPEFQLCVLSRWLNGAKRADGVGFPVDDVTITDSIVDSQRDRLPGHKKHKKKAA